MSESEVPILVPEGKNATDLTMGELDAASYRLSADVLECLGGGLQAKRYGAYIEIAIIWAKRGGATESRDVLQTRFRDYEPDDMFHALRINTEAGGEPDPTSSSDESNEPSSLESSDDFPQS